MNILELVEADGIKLNRVSGTEYAGACPVCGGSDRFRLWTDSGNGGRWMCRGCETHGDTIDYMQHAHGMTFFDAAKAAGRHDLATADARDLRAQSRYEARRPAPAPKAWIPKAASLPCQAWRDKALAFITWAHEKLMADDARLRWLEAERGISIETARAARLGINPTTIYRERSTWGIEADGDKTRFVLPAGLVIPAFRGSEVVRVRVRLDEPKPDEPRYRVIKGSSSEPLIVGSMAGSVIVVESDLDALLVAQDTGAGVVSLGSSEIRPDAATYEMLRSAGAVFVALDNDDAGMKAAWRWWYENVPGATMLAIPAALGKDPNDARKAGLNLRLWYEVGQEIRAEAQGVDVVNGLERIEPRHCIESRQPEQNPTEQAETQPAPSNAAHGQNALVEPNEQHENEARAPGRDEPRDFIPAGQADEPTQTPAEHAADILTERAAIMEYDGGLDRMTAEERAIRERGGCYLCGCLRFWVSRWGVINCMVCHPAPDAKLIERTIVLDGENRKRESA